ncbi:pilus assembly protein FimT [Vibrio tubiashii]|nr:pilus assembly protein FimT [Vibrio tubiashii]
MSRGFTLLELLISIVVLGCLLAIGLPSFRSLSIDAQMVRAANELNGFFNQARSEAIKRNCDLWAHFSFDSYPALAHEWRLTLTESETAGAGETLLVLQGSIFKSLKLDWSYTANKIKFSGLRGRIKDGSLSFYPDGQQSDALRIKTSFAGNRVMVCGVSRSRYGFPRC